MKNGEGILKVLLAVEIDLFGLDYTLLNSIDLANKNDWEEKVYLDQWRAYLVTAQNHRDVLA